ncbi:phage baseplate assembly protein V [Paraburkholderia caballeronis]|uniref:Phage baseplate assembly protein V n=1 Tax=Paraburkholderia caballeronis TaxID=416943 RepID=A0A1H7TZM8_9BURK|nr:phage baseplate assembly protein V [Paraburkholderia caballeronis]PXW23414.1 phage baseplate assembly protein V [Paraburkholderia caballeronis]PXW98407.1 phage baseplate assembly protein V [Paraburkholderia caballeronis]RAJ95138.1 phage baseplate assembly protein V [Paraburkholderia caballeronis]SEC54908.1 phage baseplate assembly protein V [Paraburkholderia caballeronis]SEL90005.1 phage baseplate assembly protein V [Paraburkholderia caballeronis]
MSGEQGIMSRLARRVLLLVGRARVNLVNDGGAAQQVQVTVNELETIDNLNRLAEFGFTSVPPQGSDVAVVFIGGDRSNGVVVASGHQASRPRGLKAGETMIYTQDGKQIYLTASGGIVIEAKGQPVTINDASNVTCNCSGVFKVVAPGGVEFDTPTVKSTGDIVDHSGTNPNSMAQMRSIYNGHNHNDPQGGTVSTPNQAM